MASILERLQTAVLDLDLSRRRFLSRAMRTSAVLTAVAAGAGKVTEARAANVACCTLAFPHNVRTRCPCRLDWSWTCTQDRECRTWECGECYSCRTSSLRLVCHCC